LQQLEVINRSRLVTEDMKQVKENSWKKLRSGAKRMQSG